jgi:hypothetical protein
VTLLIPLSLTLPLALPAPGDELARLEFDGRKYASTELPESLTPGARSAYAAWASWAAENDYRLSLSADQRVLLAQHERRNPRAALARIAEVGELVDQLLPLPDRPTEEPVTDDEPGSWSWEDDGDALEWGTAVVLQLRDEDDQRALIERLAADFSYLRGWAASAGARAGFTLERPLCAAWLEEAEGQQEWDPEHELVNRTAQLLTLRRFGQLPYWFTQGLAWTVEWTLFDSIYCYPYRSEFVWADEHRRWPADLEQLFEDRGPLRMAELASWRRGLYQGEPARLAFGTVRFLADHRRPSLAPFAEALRLLRDREDRLDRGDGTWTRIAGYEISPDAQERLLREAAGSDVLEQASEYLRKGKRYRPPTR